MNLEITPAHSMGRPQVVIPDPMVLAVLTEEGMRKLVSDHYELLKDSEIKDMFPLDEKGLELAKKHAADFFIQICGGPRYFDQSRGAPRMVARHAPFKITPEARLVWLELYKGLIENLEIEDQLKLSFWNYLDIFSVWMINTPSSSDASSLRPKF